MKYWIILSFEVFFILSIINFNYNQANNKIINNWFKALIMAHTIAQSIIFNNKKIRFQCFWNISWISIYPFQIAWKRTFRLIWKLHFHSFATHIRSICIFPINWISVYQELSRSRHFPVHTLYSFISSGACIYLSTCYLTLVIVNSIINILYRCCSYYWKKPIVGQLSESVYSS